MKKRAGKSKNGQGGRRPGAGRKPLGDAALVYTNVGLPREQIEALDKQQTSRSAAIREIVDEWYRRTHKG